MYMYRYQPRSQGIPLGLTEQDENALETSWVCVFRFISNSILKFYFLQDIQNLLESWSEHIEKCSKIFMRVPNNYKWIFFAGKKPPFGKGEDIDVFSSFHVHSHFDPSLHKSHTSWYIVLSSTDATALSNLEDSYVL